MLHEGFTDYSVPDIDLNVAEEDLKGDVFQTKISYWQENAPGVRCLKSRGRWKPQTS